MNPHKFFVGRAIGFFILLVGLGSYLIFTGDKEDITNYPSEGTSIVAFGDSLVAGLGAKTTGGFVTMLANDLKTPIVNLGKSGDTTSAGKARLNKIFDHDPKVVLLLLGGNDFLSSVPADETFNNLEEMISEIQSHGAMVVLLGVRNGLFFDEHEARFRWIANKWGAAYVPDILDGVIGRTELMADSIHPNDAGYRIIANKVRPVLEGLLK